MLAKVPWGFNVKLINLNKAGGAQVCDNAPGCALVDSIQCSLLWWFAPRLGLPSHLW